MSLPPVRVAVVIPCYNDGATLPETVASVLEQPEPAEVIVVDDGSTDPMTLALFAELEAEEPRVHVVHKPNGGLASARMAGVAASTAPYVYPLDSDDVLLPGGLKALADALDAHPQAALAYGDFQTFGLHEEHAKTPPLFCPWLLSHLNTVPVASMVRREALLAVGGWQTRHYEDRDLWLSLAEAGWQGVKVEREVFRYRVRQGLLADSLKSHDDNVAVLQGRHPRLYAERARYRRRSRAAWPLKLWFPLVERLPVTGLRKEWLERTALILVYRLNAGQYVRFRLSRLLRSLS